MGKLEKRRAALGLKPGETIQDALKLLERNWDVPEGKAPNGRPKNIPRPPIEYPPHPEGLRRCKGCEKKKPYSEFFRRAACKDGYSVLCKECYWVRKKVTKNKDGTCPNEKPKGTPCKYGCSKKCDIFHMFRNWHKEKKKVLAALRKAKRSSRKGYSKVKMLLNGLEGFFENAEDMPLAKREEDISKMEKALDVALLNVDSAMFYKIKGWFHRLRTRNPYYKTQSLDDDKAKKRRMKQLYYDFMFFKDGKDKRHKADISLLPFPVVEKAFEILENRVGEDFRDVWIKARGDHDYGNENRVRLYASNPKEPRSITNGAIGWVRGPKEYEPIVTMQEAYEEWRKEQDDLH